MCGESHTTKSGFGRYSFEILSRLTSNPNYEIAEFASYLKDDYVSDVPWKVYPNIPIDGSNDIKIYNSNQTNQYGQWRFEKVVLDFRPDIVFDIRDYWMFAYQELSPVRPYFHWIIGPTIDSIPQKTEWLKTFENADLVLTHTDWAGDYLKSLNRPINLGPCISDSVDPEQFKPVSWTKSFHKCKFGIPPDAFIIGSVMRNQKRKLIAELFSSLRQIINKSENKKIYLYLHTSYPEINGWNIPELLQEFDIYNHVLFTYYNPNSKQMFPSLYKGVKIPCIYNHEEYAVFPNVVHGVSNDQLKDIYNMFDIYVQYAICEGLGIPQLEAAACGIPIFSINYSGMEELTSKLNGIKLDYTLTKELETGSDRANPNNNDLINKIIEWLNKSQKEQTKISKETRRLLVENYSWDKTANILCNVFDSLAPKDIWDTPMDTNHSLSIPNIQNNREFINFIVSNVLKEDHLLKTYFIQSMIRSLDETFVINNQRIETLQKKDAIKILENYLNNKIFCEQVRSGQLVMKDEFLRK